MAVQDSTAIFRVGAVVRIRNSGFGPGTIVELRGPLGPQRAQVYRVQVRKPPRPAYVEVLEEQLEPVLADTP